MKSALCLSSVLSTLLLASPVAATQREGVVALVERVVVESDAKDGPRAQIWGAIALASREYGQFEAPARGYLYVRAPRGKEEAARREWSDLQRFAGSGKCLLFGNRFGQKLTLRKFDAPPAAPDEYPMSIGVREVGDRSDLFPVARLKALRGPLSPQAGDKVAPGKLSVRYDEALVAERPTAKFVFSIEGDGVKEESEATAAKERVATWQPRLEATAGRQYTVRVWAVDGEWKSEPLSASFEVATSP